MDLLGPSNEMFLFAVKVDLNSMNKGHEAKLNLSPEFVPLWFEWNWI